MGMSPAGRTALWIGVGGFVGLAVGGLMTNPGRAEDLFGAWVVLLALYVVIVFLLTRERVARAPKPARSRAIPVTQSLAAPVLGADALAVSFVLPDVPAGFPSVTGRGDPLRVRVVVQRPGQHADAAGLRSGPSTAGVVEGAAVQLTATMGSESLQGDGITGTDGSVEFTLEPESVGELRLHADAKRERFSGEGVGAVSVVNYDEEIARLFGEFRAFGVSVLGPDAHADTARELADKLRVRADPQSAHALLELARIYELVAYGERAADRRLYLAVLQQLMVLEHADMPGATPSGAMPREA